MPFQTDSFSAIRWRPCINVGSAQLPAAAPLQVVGVVLDGDEPVYQVAQIGAGSYAAFNLSIAFNGPVNLPGGGGNSSKGVMLFGADGCMTLWDTGTPNPGDVYGVKPGQSSLTKNGVGRFIVDGIVDSGTKRMYGRWEGISSLLTKYAGSTVPLAPGNTGTFNVWYGAAGSEAVTSGPWTVTGAVRFEPVDKTGFAQLQLIDGNWYAAQSEHLARQIFGTLTASLSPGGSVLCSVTTYHNGTSPGSTVTVYDPLSTYTGVSGEQFEAHLNRWDGKYYFDWVGCAS